MSDTRIAEFESTENSFMQAVDDITSERETEDGQGDDEDTTEDVADTDEDDGEEDLAEDDDEADDGEDDSEDDDDDEQDEDEEEEEAPETESVEPKVHKLTLEDGSQIEIKDNATIKMKVDGRYKRLSVADLKSNYNGKIKHDELIRTTSEAKKKATKELDRIKNETEEAVEHVKAISEAVTQGNIMGVLDMVARMTGTEPEATQQAWIDGVTGFLEKQEKMTEEERRAEARSYRLDAEIKEKERRLAKIGTKDDEAKAAKAVKAACEEYDLNKSDLKEAHTALLNRNESLKTQGKKPVEFSLDDIVTTALQYQSYREIQSVGEDLNLKLGDNDVMYLLKVAEAEEQKKGARLNEKDYATLINKYAGKEIEKLSRKVGAKKAKTTPKRKKTKNVKKMTRSSQIWDV